MQSLRHAFEELSVQVANAVEVYYEHVVSAENGMLTSNRAPHCRLLQSRLPIPA
jgi:hypothetical protein